MCSYFTLQTYNFPGTVIINGFYVCLVARDIYQWLNKKNDGTRAADGSVTEVKQDSCCSCCC